jgi:hypothetical protein
VVRLGGVFEHLAGPLCRPPIWGPFAGPLFMSDLITSRQIIRSDKMPKKSTAAKRRGRPKTIDASTRLTLRLPDPLVEAIDSWAKAVGVGLSEAARQLIEAGLKRRPKA